MTISRPNVNAAPSVGHTPPSSKWDAARVVSPDKIMSLYYITELVCSYMNITKDELMGPGRCRRVSLARSVVFAVADLMVARSYSWISRRINRDHSTMLYHIRKDSHQVLAARNAVIAIIRNAIGDDVDRAIERTAQARNGFRHHGRAA